MSLEDLRISDPRRLLEDVADQISLDRPGVWAVLVDRPTTEQRALAVHRLPDIDPHDLDDEGVRLECSDQLYDLMWSLPIPARDRYGRSVVVTVVVRRGLNVWGPTEMFWVRAWRYSNHNTAAMDLDFLLVTEHGWCSLLFHEGGTEPHFTDATSAA